MNEAEAKIRHSFRNQKGADGFVASERQKIFNRLLGIDSFSGVYRDAGPTK